MTRTDDPFDTAFLRKLELMELVYRRVTGGHGAGELAGKGRGGRTEFREHRRYSAGDDFRYIDWNVYGRTGDFFVKEHAREERRTVRVLLDCSASMAFGKPSKSECGKQLAAAFAYLALAAGDDATVTAFGDGVHRTVTVSGRKSRIREVFGELRDVKPHGRTSISQSLREIRSGRGRSMVVLISDLLAPDCRQEVASLATRGFEPCVIQLLAPDELAPTATGKLRLTDSETAEARNIWVEGPELLEYKSLVNEFIGGWRTFCARHGISFVTACSDVPVDELIIGYLREGGLVR